jgi:hypothetical protein
VRKKTGEGRGANHREATGPLIPQAHGGALRASWQPGENGHLQKGHHGVMHATEPRLGESSGAHRLFREGYFVLSRRAEAPTGEDESRYGASRQRP